MHQSLEGHQVAKALNELLQMDADVVGRMLTLRAIAPDAFLGDQDLTRLMPRVIEPLAPGRPVSTDTDGRRYITWLAVLSRICDQDLHILSDSAGVIQSVVCQPKPNAAN